MALPPAWGTSEYFIPQRLLLLARMIEREMSRDLQAGFNITVADWRVLARACSTGSTNAAEIRSAFEADRAEVSRAVARLLKLNLIRREPDTHHRQKMRITPTEAGREIFDGIRKMREAYCAFILQDLPSDARRALDEAMLGIATRVDERRSVKSASGEHADPLVKEFASNIAPGLRSERRHGKADPATEGDDSEPDQD